MPIFLKKPGVLIDKKNQNFLWNFKINVFGLER